MVPRDQLGAAAAFEGRDDRGVPRRARTLHGIETAPWWDRQLGLALLGGLVQFGWEKALGGRNAELEWWEARALDGARFL